MRRFVARRNTPGIPITEVAAGGTAKASTAEGEVKRPLPRGRVTPEAEGGGGASPDTHGGSLPAARAGRTPLPRHPHRRLAAQAEQPGQAGHLRGPSGEGLGVRQGQFAPAVPQAGLDFCETQLFKLFGGGEGAVGFCRNSFLRPSRAALEFPWRWRLSLPNFRTPSY